MRTKRQSGFTLIELMVAMVVTLMVTGAVYGLLAGGQNAFRREPELSDRQQNIRAAMDMIMRDIATAGSGMPSFIQTFTPNLNNLGPFVGSSGNRTDELEIMGNPNNSAFEQGCGSQGTGQSHVFMTAGQTTIQPGTVVMVILRDGTWTFRNIVDIAKNPPNTGSDRCNAGDDHQDLSYNAGNADNTGMNLPGGLCAGNTVMDASGNCVACDGATGTACCSPLNPIPDLRCSVDYILGGEIIRYRIRTDADGVPNLERFSSALAANWTAGGVPTFQVVARGIDDLQVRYTAANGTAPDSAGVVDQTKKDYGTLIQSVTVTLSARSEVANVMGMQTATSGPAALRGTLTSVGTPRATLNVLATPLTSRVTGALASPSPWN